MIGLLFEHRWYLNRSRNIDSKIERASHSAANASRINRMRTQDPSSRGSHAAHAAGSVAVRGTNEHSLLLIKFFVVIATTVLLAILIGMGFASAGNYAGSGVQSDSVVEPSKSESHPLALSNNSNAEILSTAATRDMTQALAYVQAEEEAARIAAEEKARAEEQAAIERAQRAQQKSAANGGVDVYAVDFTVGKEAFIAEWSARIDDYLEGSPLAGYGVTFATAAWKYGVDPRWSPAISNTESTKGENCFAWHNAWGWNGGSWSNWTSAINAHVAGLSNMYGYTISYYNAKVYCPPNYNSWYYNTLNEMRKI